MAGAAVRQPRFTLRLVLKQTVTVDSISGDVPGLSTDYQTTALFNKN